MVLLSNSGELARKYAPYIQELQEFFALHDLRCGAPGELAFVAARLSGRDSFPGEFASMVRSFIFRERGSMPLPDLLTVVALAVGGSAIADSGPELQNSLNELSTFVASVARAPHDQPPPAPPVDEPEALEATPIDTARGSREFQDRLEPADSANPFLPSASSDAATLSPAAVSASDLRQTSDLRQGRLALPQFTSNRRKPWAAAAIGLPLFLLAAFLYHQAAPPSAAPYPETEVPLPATPAASIAAPHALTQTPLSSVATSLAQPTSAASPHPGLVLPSTIAKPRVSAIHAASPSTLTVSTLTPPPSSVLAGTPSSPLAGHSAPSAPASNSPARPSPNASLHPTRTLASHGPAIPASRASLSADQASFGVSSGIMTSHLLSSTQPRYPRLAAITHVEGEVVVQAVVSKTGKVTAVHVLSGHYLLRKAAVSAVRQWRYRPYVADGHPVDVATIISINMKPHS